MTQIQQMDDLTLFVHCAPGPSREQCGGAWNVLWQVPRTGWLWNLLFCSLHPRACSPPQPLLHGVRVPVQRECHNATYFSEYIQLVHQLTIASIFMPSLVPKLSALVLMWTHTHKSLTRLLKLIKHFILHNLTVLDITTFEILHSSGRKNLDIYTVYSMQ